MTGVVFRTMARSFLRDRGAVAMSVVLPVIVFLVFAAILAGASGEQLRITVIIADEQHTPVSRRFVDALANDSTLIVTTVDSAAAVERAVRLGAADAGLVIRAGGRALSDLAGDGAAPVLVVADPVRAVAGRVLAGQVQRAYFGALPDVALRSTADLLGSGFVTFTPTQQESLDAHFKDMTKELTESPERGGGPFDALLERETTVGAGLATSHVAYYAGAIAFLFLLFSAMHGALSFLDERDSGLLDRILAGPGGMGALIRGKFLFLVVQGVLQVLLIFVVAWAFYGVALVRHFGAFAILTTAAAICAAGLALAITLACRTRRQAQTISNVLILLLSAVGGSMVPRFLMPPALQRLGWLTPTTWAVEGYSAIFWRGELIAAIALPVILLAGTGAAALAAARMLSRRVERI